MGYNQAEFKVTARLSNHNSPQDAQDEALWDELTERLKEICEEPKYALLIVLTGYYEP